MANSLYHSTDGSLGVGERAAPDVPVLQNNSSKNQQSKDGPAPPRKRKRTVEVAAESPGSGANQKDDGGVDIVGIAAAPEMPVIQVTVGSRKRKRAVKFTAKPPATGADQEDGGDVDRIGNAAAPQLQGTVGSREKNRAVKSTAKPPATGADQDEHGGVNTSFNPDDMAVGVLVAVVFNGDACLHAAKIIEALPEDCWKIEFFNPDPVDIARAVVLTKDVKKP